MTEMEEDIIMNDLEEIQIQTHPSNIPANVSYIPFRFTLISVGKDAIVVRHHLAPSKVYKVFSNATLPILEKELEAYHRLEPSPYFATCYGRGPNCLILSYEPGHTFYECLVLGIEIPPSAIDGVNHAIRHAVSCGLYPKDIHLKNVILQPNGIKLIDLSPYLEPGEDRIWPRFVEGYHRFYPLIRGKKIPRVMMEKVKQIYLHDQSPSHAYDYIQKLFDSIKR